MLIYTFTERGVIQIEKVYILTKFLNYIYRFLVSKIIYICIEKEWIWYKVIILTVT